MKGIVRGIFVSPAAGLPMRELAEAEAIAGRGLAGDRYAAGEGSFNRGNVGRRQVTLMNAIFFEGSGFAFADSRRNLFVEGVELMWLIGREFAVGAARLRGVKYCDPCGRPSALAEKEADFRRAFIDRGGLIAEVLEGGLIRVGDDVVPPPKGY